MKVSVIIPVYNVEKYLERCLYSVVNQSLEDIEIICINDGSTDNSFSILKDFAKKDSRIVVVNQNNMGISATRNTGIDLAKGEFIAFIDSDDWINSIFLEKLYNAAVENQCDIAAGDIYRVNKLGKSTAFLKYDKMEVKSTVNEKFKTCNIPSYCYVWNRIYKRLPLQKNKIRFIEGKHYEDVMFSHLVLFYLGNFVTVPNANYYYFRHSESIVSKTRRNKQLALDALEMDKKSEEFRQVHNIDISGYAEKIKKYKILGITICKTIYVPKKKKEYYLFNCKIYEKKNS